MIIDFRTPQDDNVPSIHDQVKNKVLFSKEHWNIKSFMHDNWIKYNTYYRNMSYNKAGKKFLQKLVDIGIILNDDILKHIYPKM